MKICTETQRCKKFARAARAATPAKASDRTDVLFILSLYPLEDHAATARTILTIRIPEVVPDSGIRHFAQSALIEVVFELLARRRENFDKTYVWRRPGTYDFEISIAAITIEPHAPVEAAQR